MTDPDGPGGPRFEVGSRVLTKVISGPEHCRIPRYAQGRVGTIERTYQAMEVPEQRAVGVAKPEREPVYTVRFDARELWGDSVEPGCSIRVDAWERYLRPMTAD
ncbi:MAG: SH3-like domain-containing protein [Chloroflexota bacterium]